ncbi:MAG TPA: hypothetical protein VH500_25705 [Nitrososphaeraceae archaeon]|jgi:hypothetical protein
MIVTRAWDSYPTLGLSYSTFSSFYIEDDRNLTTKNLHARLTLIRNAKLQAEIVNKIIKQFPNMPDQWIASAQYILFSVISSYLQTADQNELERDMTLAEAKDMIKHSVLAHTARIIAEIDTYPDIANVENWYQRHDQLRMLFGD